MLQKDAAVFELAFGWCRMKVKIKCNICQDYFIANNMGRMVCDSCKVKNKSKYYNFYKNNGGIKNDMEQQLKGKSNQEILW